MAPDNFKKSFTPEVLTRLFPAERSDAFFDALFGDAAEGAFDITLEYGGYKPESNQLLFELRLHQRPGKCLACNLTHGLPTVFTRHPVIDIKGLVKGIDGLLVNRARSKGWRLGSTRSVSSALHIIPLIVDLVPRA